MSSAKQPVVETRSGAFGPEAVSFIIPVRNDAHGLRRCLTSISAQSPGIEVLVVDNGSSDDSREVGRAFGAKVLELPGLSIASLRNRAAAATTRPLVAFVDADMELAPGWLDAALALFRDPSIVAAGAEYTPQPGATWVQRAYDGFRAHTPGITAASWLASGNMIVRRGAFERAGGFDESLRTCEDWDLCVRLRGNGSKIVADSRLRNVHYGDPASLVDLFRGELWRGRDNLKVSLRTVPAWRDLPGILVPIFWLIAIAATVSAALAAVPLQGAVPLWLMMPLAGAVGLSTLRAVRLWRRVTRRHGVSWWAAYAVAVTYDVARGLATVVTVPHRRARAVIAPATT